MAMKSQLNHEPKTALEVNINNVLEKNSQQLKTKQNNPKPVLATLVNIGADAVKQSNTNIIENYIFMSLLLLLQTSYTAIYKRHICFLKQCYIGLLSCEAVSDCSK